jgi:hypothetical protein
MIPACRIFHQTVLEESWRPSVSRRFDHRQANPRTIRARLPASEGQVARRAEPDPNESLTGRMPFGYRARIRRRRSVESIVLHRSDDSIKSPRARDSRNVLLFFMLILNHRNLTKPNL